VLSLPSVVGVGALRFLFLLLARSRAFFCRIGRSLQEEVLDHHPHPNRVVVNYHPSQDQAFHHQEEHLQDLKVLDLIVFEDLNHQMDHHLALVVASHHQGPFQVPAPLEVVQSLESPLSVPPR